MFNLHPRIAAAAAVKVAIKLPSTAMVITLACAVLSGPLSAAQITPQTLSFAKAIRVAQQNDPWLNGNIEKQKSLESLSYVSDTLPDPKVSIGVGNLAADSLEFDQEPMTQFKVGITQMFPRGNSQAIKSKQLKIESQQYPLQRQDRKAKVAVTVGGLWLDAFKAQQTVKLVASNIDYFEQLLQITESDYSSAKGDVRQQDVVIVQVEITRLQDRLVQLAQEKSRFQGLLSQWLSDYSIDSVSNQNYESVRLDNFNVDDHMPHIEVAQAKLVYSTSWFSQNKLAHYFTKHPSVLSIDKKLLASQSGVNLAQQKYQPEWGVTASYAYRDDDPMGNERSDLLSIGVVFDLPLFTENKQDQEVKSAISQAEMIKTEKTLLLRKMMSSFTSAKGRLISLQQRQALYTTKLIPQLNQQIDSSLMAYTNGDANFSDVLRARMSLINTKIDQLNINITEQKLLLELNYLFMQTESQYSTDMKQANNSLFGDPNDY